MTHSTGDSVQTLRRKREISKAMNINLAIDRQTDGQTSSQADNCVFCCLQSLYLNLSYSHEGIGLNWLVLPFPNGISSEQKRRIESVDISTSRPINRASCN